MSSNTEILKQKIVDLRSRQAVAVNEAEMSRRAFGDAAVALETRSGNITAEDVAKARSGRDLAAERVEVLTAAMTAAERELQQAEAADRDSDEERQWAEASKLRQEMLELHEKFVVGLRAVDGLMIGYLEKAARLNEVSPVRLRADVSPHFAAVRVVDRLDFLTRNSLKSWQRLTLAGTAGREAAWRCERDLQQAVNEERQLLSWYGDRNHKQTSQRVEPDPVPSAAAQTGVLQAKQRPARARGMM